MSCFDPDGPGQCSGDRLGKRKESFLVLTTGFPLFWHIYNLAQSVIFLSTYTAHTARDLQCFSSLPFKFLFPNFVTFLWSWVKLFTFVVEWMMIFFLRWCRGSILVYWTMYLVQKTCITFGENLFIKPSARISYKSRRKSYAFLSRKLVQAHKIHCT